MILKYIFLAIYYLRKRDHSLNKGLRQLLDSISTILIFSGSFATLLIVSNKE